MILFPVCRKTLVYPKRYKIEQSSQMKSIRKSKTTFQNNTLWSSSATGKPEKAISHGKTQESTQSQGNLGKPGKAIHREAKLRQRNTCKKKFTPNAWTNGLLQLTVAPGNTKLAQNSQRQSGGVAFLGNVPLPTSEETRTLPRWWGFELVSGSH